MDNAQQRIRYYLFSTSNFMSAVGGGMILGKGIATIQIPFLQGGSLLAFFVGTIFGLILLQFTQNNSLKYFLVGFQYVAELLH